MGTSAPFAERMNLLHANDRPGQYPASFYAATATPFPPQPALQGDHQTDVAIIGAGFTGLSAALHLAEKGFKVTVLEAHRVGFGASGRNGGQLGTGQRLDQATLESLLGRDMAHQLWDIGAEAKALVKSLIQQHKMPVTFYPGIAHPCRTAAEVKHSQDNAALLARDYNYTGITPLTAKEMAALIGSKTYLGGDIDRGAGHLHPLNYAIGIANAALTAGATLHETSEVTRIDYGPTITLHTANGRLTAQHLILACNGYLGTLEPKVAAKVMPINSYIIATEPLNEPLIAEPVAVTDTKFVNNYWRMSEDGRLLFGGAETYGYKFPDIPSTVRKPLLKVYPQLGRAKIDYAWGGTLAITMNRLPCFTRPQKNTLNASGYSGYGVAMASMAGKILAEAIAGQAGRFDLMAGLPQTPFPGGAKLRSPMLVLAMTWYAMRDRLGF